VTIRSKLGFGLLVLVLALLLPLALAHRALDRLYENTRELRDREFAASLLLGRMRAISDEMRQTELRLLFIADDDALPRMREHAISLAELSDSLGGLGLTTASQNIAQSVAEVERHATSVHAAIEAERTAEADSISSAHLVPAINRVDAVIGTASQSLRESTSARVRTATEETAQASQQAFWALALALALALAVAFALYRSVSRPVRDLETGMTKVASGDFDHRLQTSPNRQDEFGRLAISFAAMQQQLAELDRLKAEFISIASHELKTPVNVIGGYVQLMQDGVYGDLNVRQQEVLGTLENQVQALGRLVHQLLDVSRFEAGGGRIEPRAVELAELVEELEQAFRVLALQRSIDFRVERSGALPREVIWDPDRMNEVLGNLLSNAFKFTSRGGSVELRLEAHGGDVQILVRDTGAGIAADQLPHVFGKFWQGDNQALASAPGTGLGLAIARQIVEAHGGDIGAASTEGVGTTFWLTLPWRAGDPVARHPLPPSGAVRA
jgi:signal transduction histidine kinase